MSSLASVVVENDLKGSPEFERWKTDVSSGTVGELMTEDDVDTVLNTQFVGQSVMILWDVSWYPCICYYSSQDEVRLLCSDGETISCNREELVATIQQGSLKCVQHS